MKSNTAERVHLQCVFIHLLFAKYTSIAFVGTESDTEAAVSTATG